MRSVLTALLGFLLVFGAEEVGAAQPLPDADAQAVRTVIERQIEAFRADDGVAAYGFAAPNIQAIFPTPEAFMAMVKNGYQPVYRPKSFTFGPSGQAAGQPTQILEIVGPDGDYWTALYTLARQPDGSWKISGCVLVHSQAGAA